MKKRKSLLLHAYRYPEHLQQRHQNVQPLPSTSTCIFPHKSTTMPRAPRALPPHRLRANPPMRAAAQEAAVRIRALTYGNAHSSLENLALARASLAQPRVEEEQQQQQQHVVVAQQVAVVPQIDVQIAVAPEHPAIKQEDQQPDAAQGIKDENGGAAQTADQSAIAPAQLDVGASTKQEDVDETQSSNNAQRGNAQMVTTDAATKEEDDERKPKVDNADPRVSMQRVLQLQTKEEQLGG